MSVFDESLEVSLFTTVLLLVDDPLGMPTMRGLKRARFFPLSDVLILPLYVPRFLL